MSELTYCRREGVMPGHGKHMPPSRIIRVVAKYLYCRRLAAARHNDAYRQRHYIAARFYDMKALHAIARTYESFIYEMRKSRYYRLYNAASEAPH